MERFNVGDKVRGRFWKFTLGKDVVWIDFEGTVVTDFQDGSYEVETTTGHNVLVDLYKNNKMELLSKK
jgi:hypothetical protein